MGGYGTFDAIERYPDLFAAAMPVCGGGDTSRAASIAHYSYVDSTWF
jgi:predicted peptidase